MKKTKEMGRVALYEITLKRTGSVVWPLSENVASDRDATLILQPLLGSRDCEHFAVLMLDARGSVLGVHVAAIGGIHGIQTLRFRDVFKAALVANASSIIVSHNHPSGDPTPSAEDMAFTEKLIEAGKLLGCPVVDHVIVTPGGKSASFLQRGILF